MGIMDFFRKKAEGKSIEEIEDEVYNEEVFIPDISLFELDSVNWSQFGLILKQNNILPNSYPRKPVRVEVSLDKDNRPMATLEFNSSTSDSVRKYILMQDSIVEYINGVKKTFNNDLNKVWNKYQNEIRYKNARKTMLAGYNHRRRGKELMNKAVKMIEMDDIESRELEFLEKYKDTRFDGFHYTPVFEKDGEFYRFEGELPKFIPLEEVGDDGYYRDGEPVMPFTPKSLEFCILRMTNGQKIEEGESLANFENKCRQIQEYSCFESEDWDRVIEFGKDIVKSQYQVAVLENEI